MLLKNFYFKVAHDNPYQKGITDLFQTTVEYSVLTEKITFLYYYCYRKPIIYNILIIIIIY